MTQEQTGVTETRRTGGRRGFRFFLKHAYREELPRTVRQVGWLIVLIAAIEAAGFLVGYRAAGRATWGQMMDNPEGWLPLFHWASPWLQAASENSGWSHYLLHNTFVAVRAWIGSVVTLGTYACWSAWMGGFHLGWIIRGGMPTVAATSGLGPGGATAAMLLPHGLFELPAFWLAWALGLRTGLVWLWRLRWGGRWESFTYLGRDSGRALVLLVVPLLLVAGVLEAEVSPWVRDRYVIGVRPSPALAAERVVLRDVLSRVAIAPDGNTCVGLEGRTAVLNRRRPAARTVLFTAPKGTRVFAAPSQDGRQVATVINHEPERPALWIVDVATMRRAAVRGTPGHYCGTPAWSPDGRRLALVVRGGAPGAGGKPTIDLWTVDLRTQRWRQLTHLPATTKAYVVSPPAWNPRGNEIAFTRQASREHETAIWAVRSSGKGLRQVTRGKHDCVPAWSPDGKWIAFLSRPWSEVDLEEKPFVQQEVELADLCLVHPNGKDRQERIARADPSSPLTWSADGTSLYYMRLDLLLKGTPRAVATSPRPAS